jgi:response regulator NasT
VECVSFVRVLLADSDAERAGLVEALLARGGAVAVSRLAPGEALLDAVARIEPDVVIVDMARPDRDALDDIRNVTRHAPRPIVMFVDQDDRHFMEEAIAAGVSSYNVVGVDLPQIKPIIQAAVALFRRYRQVEEELRKAETSLRERALIDRAKALLMRRRRIGEPEAYRWLRRQAMDRGRRIVDVARALLDEAEAAAPSEGHEHEA